MSVYMVTFVTVQNVEWVSEYIAKVPPIVRSHGGKYLAIAKNVPDAVDVVEGTAPAPDGIAILTFPSMDALKGFVNAPEYAPFRNARIAGTRSDFFAFENDDDAPQFAGQ